MVHPSARRPHRKQQYGESGRQMKYQNERPSLSKGRRKTGSRFPQGMNFVWYTDVPCFIHLREAWGFAE